MPRFHAVFGTDTIEFELPEGTECLSMSEPVVLDNPKEAIARALRNPIGSPKLDEIVRKKLKMMNNITVAIVISDNTRSVQYTGESGILSPIVDLLILSGIKADDITVIVATGTHRILSQGELMKMIDPAIFEKGIRIVCHDCHNDRDLKFLGMTSRGTRVLINRFYLESDIKILTGLVESHFMAGASGGRKSICPGLMGEESTHVFHGPWFLSSERARDLILEGNPCHEESLEIARMAGVDFILNVTQNNRFELTGVFAGDIEKAHMKAVEWLSEYVRIPIDHEYDIVITHAGFVGINHYQAAKAAVVAIPTLKFGGRLIIAANNVDKDPVGSASYRKVLSILTANGPEDFIRRIKSSEWKFMPEQWQVQMWAKVFFKIPIQNLTYCAPHIKPADAALIPGKDGNLLLPSERRYSCVLQDAAEMVENEVEYEVQSYTTRGLIPSIAFLRDGPYGIPIKRTGPRPR